MRIASFLIFMDGDFATGGWTDTNNSTELSSQRRSLRSSIRDASRLHRKASFQANVFRSAVYSTMSSAYVPSNLRGLVINPRPGPSKQTGRALRYEILLTLSKEPSARTAPLCIALIISLQAITVVEPSNEASWLLVKLWASIP
jgi:hypothetical protein